MNKSVELLDDIQKKLDCGNYKDAYKELSSLMQSKPSYAEVLDFLLEYCLTKSQGKFHTEYVIKPSNQVTFKEDLERKSRRNLSINGALSKLPVTVLIISWDIGHNPLGRAYMLAEAVQRVTSDVVLAGFQFERYGNDVWEPVKQSKIPVIPLQGKLLPDMLYEAEKIVERYSPDIVIACKPRLPSLTLGMMFKARKGIPLIIDVDDHELSFTKNKSPTPLSNFLYNSEGYALIKEPYESEWTQLAHNFVNFADGILVSNIALEREFGGRQIPHVRDETTFNPALFNAKEVRKRFGVPESAKVVMFFGTPRIHKGIGKVAEAVGNIANEDFLFVVVGTSPDRRVTDKLESLSKGKLINIPNQPFSSIPEILSMADLVCLPQDVTHETSKYQLPAKAMDAIAMCKPLLVSKTEPLGQLVKAGVAEYIEEQNLSRQIEQVAIKVIDVEEFAQRRAIFLSNYSYKAAEKTLRQVFIDVLKLDENIDVSPYEKFWEQQKSIFPIRSINASSGERDIVIFWKQNDSGIYGRRHDMVAKTLSKLPFVRKVLIIDAPISTYDLDSKIRKANHLTQERSVYVRTYEKHFGQLDSPKLAYDVFIHKPGIYYTDVPIPGRKPIIEDYCDFLSSVFKRESIQVSESTFWFYPKNYLANDIIDIFEPKNVVVDVVDDHRTWPGVSEAEIKKLTSHYSSIVNRADLVLANCKSVYDSMSEYNSNILLVPNGCESEPALTSLDNDFMKRMREHDGPIVGFVGNLESKIDIKLLERLAETIPNVLLALVGSTHAYPEIAKLAERPNVLMPGVIENKYVNTIIQQFSVCIVPHKKTALTASMNPLKVFVYLSNRKPVVTTDIDNLPDSEAIFISENHDHFISNILAAINNKVSDSVYKKFIQKNSWESRFNCLHEFFKRN